jgi:hypothetical protein
MPTLNPNTNFEISSEQPVTATDYSGLFNAVSDIGTTQVKTEVKRRAEDAESQAEAALNANVISGLKKIRAADRAGKTDLARALELNLITEYTKAGGDIGSTTFKTQAESITGRPVESFSQTDEEIALQSLKESTEYRSSYLGTFATHPDIENSEREAIAMGVLAIREARQAHIDNASFDFTSETSAAYIGEIDDFTNQIFGAANIVAAQAGFVSLEEVNDAIIMWQTLVQNRLTVPDGVTPEAWAPVKAKIEATTKLFETLKSAVGPEGVAAEALSNFQRAVKMSDLKDTDKNALIISINNNPEFFSSVAGLPLDEQVRHIRNSDTSNGTVVTEEDVLDPTTDLFPQIDESTSPADLFGRARTSLSVSKGFGNTLTNSSDARKNWSQTVVRGVDAIGKLATRGEYISEDSLNSFFSQAFYRNLEAVRMQDPERAEAIEARTVTALVDAGLATQAQLGITTASGAFIYDEQQSSFTVNEESLRRAVGNNDVSDKLLSAIHETYGSDFNALVEDKGLALQDADDKGVIYGKWLSVTNGLGAPSETQQSAANSMFAISSALGKFTSTTAKKPQASSSSPAVVPKDVQQDTEFLSSVSSLSNKLGMDPNDLLRAMHFETGGTFMPNQKSATSNATGLIQFIPSTAKELGTTVQELATMSRAEQMGFVDAYLSEKLRNVDNPGFDHVYMAIHYPAAVNKDDSYVIYRKGSNNYKANKGLDTNKDGTVTRGEAWQKAAGNTSGMGTTEFPDTSQADAEANAVRPPLKPQAEIEAVIPRLRSAGVPEEVLTGDIESEAFASQVSASPLKDPLSPDS